MPEIHPGEIYFARLPKEHTVGSEQHNDRPFVIVSRLSINRNGRIVVGVPLTTNTKKACGHRMKLPVQEIIPSVYGNFEFKDSVLLTDQVRVLDVERLQMPDLGKLSKTALLGLTGCLAFVFDIR